MICYVTQRMLYMCVGISPEIVSGNKLEMYKNSKIYHPVRVLVTPVHQCAVVTTIFAV